MQTLLLVDDDETFTSVLARALGRMGISCKTASDNKSAIRQLTDDPGISHAVVDLNLGADSGLKLIPTLLENNPSLKVVVLTGYSSIATAVEAVKKGAVNYLCKPASASQIIEAFADPEESSNIIAPNLQKPTIDRMEWEYIQKTLTDNNGNISATARALGMHRRTLQRKLQKKPRGQS